MTIYRYPPGVPVPAVQFMRRGDQVALVANGLVIHLCPETARAIGAMLIEAADEIEQEKRDTGLLEAFG